MALYDTSTANIRTMSTAMTVIMTRRTTMTINAPILTKTVINNLSTTMPVT